MQMAWLENGVNKFCEFYLLILQLFNIAIEYHQIVIITNISCCK